MNLAHASTRLIELYLQFGCGSLQRRSCEARTTLKFENRSTLYSDFRTSNGGQLRGLLINTVKAFFFFRTDLYKCSESSGNLIFQAKPSLVPRPFLYGWGEKGEGRKGLVNNSTPTRIHGISLMFNNC